ncbi:hypothetical protein Hanom_Chr11g01013941 [Helianthus anomalus]
MVLISQASVLPVTSLTPPPLFTTSMVVATSAVSMPLVSNPAPASTVSVAMFDSPMVDPPTFVGEIPATSARGESTSAKDTTSSDTGGSSGNSIDDGGSLFDDLYLPSVYCDPHAQDKRYQPNWKITESSRLVFPPVVHHWVEQAYPPVESVYVYGLDNEHLMNVSMVEAVSGPQRLAEIRHRWMQDNNDLRQTRMAIQELVDERNRFESQLHAAGVRESWFLSEKNKAEADLKHINANLAEERLSWAQLEREAVLEARKDLTLQLEASEVKIHDKQVELEEPEGKLRELQQACDALVAERNQLLQTASSQQARLNEAESTLDQVTVEVDSLTNRLAGLQGDRNSLISHGLVGAFEFMRRFEPFVALLDRLSTASYKSGQHDGVYEGYVSCHQMNKLTPNFKRRWAS